jgi:hypothetical protein
MNQLYVIRIIATGNLLNRRGSELPMMFDSIENAEMYISIYNLRRSIMEIIPNPIRMPRMGELD